VIFMKIDFHCHLFYERSTVSSMLKVFQAFKGYGFQQRILETLERIPPIVLENVILKTHAHAKRAGIEKIVLLAASANENKRITTWIKVIPDFFIPFFNPPEKSTNQEEISQAVEKALKEDGFKGLKILIAFRGKPINTKILYPAYEIAQQYEVPVLIHTGYPPPGTPGQKMQLRMANPALLDEVIASFPKLKLVMSHCGYPWTDIAIALACQFPSVYLDISNMMYMLPHKLRNILLHAKEIIGVNKILYGSDGFCPEMVEACVHLFEASDYLMPEEKRKILGENAQRLLNSKVLKI